MSIQTLKRWLPLAIITALIGTAWASGIMELASLEAIKAQRESLLEHVSTHPVLSITSFIALYTIAVALSLPIATILTLLGGFLFGSILGTIAIVIGASTGATILFLIARSAIGSTLREKAGPLYDKVAENMKKNAIGYMLFMRLMPLFPFFLVNIVPALFNIRLLPYIATTVIGILPGTFVYANVGRELGTIESLSDLASPQTLIAFSLLGLFALTPTIYKQIKNRKKLLSLMIAASLIPPSTALASENYNNFLKLYDTLLQTHIHHSEKDSITYNGVNYDRWAADPKHKTALKLLQTEDPASYQGQKQKAFWINAYNFLTIELIIRENERQSIKNLGGLFTTPWQKHTWKFASQDYSLDHIEHKILRPMGDARIHFAINCASVSCPDLRTQSYRASALNQQLNEQVKTTLTNKGKGLKTENNTIYTSKIFNWFAEDFNDGDIKGWLKNYENIDKNAPLKFMKYDWSLNKTTTR